MNMNDARAAARAAVDAAFDDLCADGHHVFEGHWRDKIRRCRCGAVHPLDLPKALGEE